MAEGLVGASLLVVGVGHWVFTTVRSGSRVRGVVGTVGLGTSADGLVGVRGLLSGDATVAAVLVVVGGAAGAAADAESPEDGTNEGKGDSQPGRGEHVLADAQADSVGFEKSAGAAVNDGEKNGRGNRGGGGEEEENNGDQSSDAAAPAAADGEDADKQLSDTQDEGDQVGDEHPLGDGLVDLHNLVVVGGELILDGVVVAQAPDVERIEVVLGLGLGALGGLVVAVLDAALAVAPETDGVEVGESGVILDGFQGTGDLVGSDGGDVVLAQEVLDFGDGLGTIAADILQIDLKRGIC